LSPRGRGSGVGASAPGLSGCLLWRVGVSAGCCATGSVGRCVAVSVGCASRCPSGARRGVGWVRVAVTAARGGVWWATRGLVVCRHWARMRICQQARPQGNAYAKVRARVVLLGLVACPCSAVVDSRVCVQGEEDDWPRRPRAWTKGARAMGMIRSRRRRQDTVASPTPDAAQPAARRPPSAGGIVRAYRPAAVAVAAGAGPPG
jgi:hypothetical protein